MFSQWRHAVENLTQHSPKPSQDGSPNPNDPASASRASIDSTNGTTPPPLSSSTSSSSQLADSALSSLRKTLATQRPASPGIQRSNSTDSTTATSTATSPHPSRSRTTLEDRLRAKLAATAAAANNSTSSQTTTGTGTGKHPANATSVQVTEHPLSPVPPPAEVEAEAEKPAESKEKDDESTVNANMLSPKSTPLPDSPEVAASEDATVPLSAITAQPLSPAVVEDSGTTDDVLEKGGEGTEVVGAKEEDAGEADEKVDVRAEGEGEGSEAKDESVEPPPVEEKENAVEEAVKDDVPSQASITPDEHDAPHSPSPDPSTEVSKESEPEVAHVVEEPNPVPEPSTNETEAVPSAEEPLSAQPSDTTTEAEPSATSEPQDTPTTTESSPEPPTVHEDTTHIALSNGHADAPAAKGDEVDIEALQKRLKLVEQRFTDVSTSFKRLQAEKAAADRILQEMTSVQTIQEVDALRDFFQNMNMKAEMAQDEIRRLNGKLTRQEERIEEMRDIHRLESKSQSDLITKLRAQVAETEALLKAGQSSSHHAEEEAVKHKAEVEKLRVEVEKAKTTAKDEEEKRTKAVSLLKTVRQKLVKAEKDREDAVKELATVKAHEKEEREKDRVEKQKLHEEVEREHRERETAVQGLKERFDKEVAGLKDRQEKELTALRGQYELEVITLKSLHTKEIETKSSRISDLETSLQIVSREKDEIFDQLQMRQAELESSQSHLESLQSQTMELQHQLREATDRIALLTDEVAEAQKTQFTKVESSVPSAEVTQLLSATEAKYESRIADLRRQLTAVERERDETEADLSRKITEKVKEVDQLKSIVGRSAKAREEEEETVASLKKEIETLRDAGAAYERLIAELQTQAGKVTEVESTAQAQIAEVKSALALVEKQLEETRAKEAQARAHNKTLREELRKVQSSAALLERQRNPGVGYWGSKGESTTDLRSPTSSTSDLPRETARPASPSTKADEDVNYEYLRNVILQFLEHKEMRPHLVRVLSTILRFTPQETRRLVAKV